MKKLKLKKQSKVALVYRPDSANALTLGQTIARWLKERGHSVYTAPEQRLLKGTLKCRTSADFKKMHLVLVLGGDGTYLRAVRLMEGGAVPILGVNLGSLGFLTPTRAEEMFSTVEQALMGHLELVPRSVMKVRIFSGSKTYKDYLALNDLVLERGPFSQLINMEIFSEKHLVSSVKADGLIIASPTGSTAYNLSAGGPILHPQVSALVVTPIAPHSLTNRPLIFPDDRELSFRMVTKVQSKQAKSSVVIDGQKVSEIGPMDRVAVTRHKVDHLMVCIPGANYFELLREKLKFGDRT